MAEDHSHEDPLLAHLRTLICACLERARSALRGPRMPTPASVHNARKFLKQARAALRLMRNAMGEIEYRRGNRRLRNIGLALSRVRDAEVTMVTFDKVVATLPPRRTYEALRRRLERSACGTREARLDASTRSAIVMKLDDEIERITGFRAVRWNIERFKDDARKIYRRGRKSFVRACRRQADKPLHEARKAAKYLSLALEALRTGGIQVSTKAARRAHALGHFLGQDHDLVVLTSQLTSLPDDPAIDRRELRAAIATARQKARARAFRAGRRLYDRNPKAFVSRCIDLPMAD